MQQIICGTDHKKDTNQKKDHIADIKHKGDKVTGIHFNSSVHSLDNFRILNIEIIIPNILTHFQREKIFGSKL